MPCIRIERVVNGYTVCVQDPKIVTKNNLSNSKWEDADREFVFKNEEQVLKFIELNIEKALPEKVPKPSSFDAAFKEAVADDNDEDD